MLKWTVIAIALGVAWAQGGYGYQPQAAFGQQLGGQLGYQGGQQMLGGQLGYQGGQQMLGGQMGFQGQPAMGGQMMGGEQMMGQGMGQMNPQMGQMEQMQPQMWQQYQGAMDMDDDDDDMMMGQWQGQMQPQAWGQGQQFHQPSPAFQSNPYYQEAQAILQQPLLASMPLPALAVSDANGNQWNQAAASGKNLPIIGQPAPVTLPAQELTPHLTQYPVKSTQTRKEHHTQPVTQHFTQPIVQRVQRQAVPVQHVNVNRYVQPVVNRVVQPIVSQRVEEIQPAPAQVAAKKGH